MNGPIAAVVALYADGGVMKVNPSPYGGMCAWCGVDKDGVRIIERGCVVPALSGKTISNNVTEQMAIVLALEAMPDGWSGTIYSDSRIALGRVAGTFKGTKGLPPNLIERTRRAHKRMGALTFVLLQGHPTKADLARGTGKKRGLPVSLHNCWCDEECTRQGKAYMSQLEKVGI